MCCHTHARTHAHTYTHTAECIVMYIHLQTMVGEIHQAERTFIKPYSIWRALGVLPEMYNIVEGKPVENHDAYHLRPGIIGGYHSDVVVIQIYRTSREHMVLVQGYW